MKIAVVGLGYVGLPLSLQFARSCVSVLGIDVDPEKVELLSSIGWAMRLTLSGNPLMVQEFSCWGWRTSRTSMMNVNRRVTF